MTINLNRIGSGHKLIKQVVEQPIKDAPWSISKQKDRAKVVKPGKNSNKQ